MPSPRVQPLHLPLFPGADGWRSALLAEPEPADRPRALVVYAPPFAEEMNKSRAMAARMARALAAQGLAVVLPDLLGTGDSPGDFAEATWERWQEDLLAAGRWLAERHHAPGKPALPMYIWGLRSGCLLACELAHREPGCAGLLLWSPVASGRQMLQQFLRLRTAAEWTSGTSGTSNASGASGASGTSGSVDAADAPGPAERASGGKGAAGVKAELATRGHADIAGYRLSATLAVGLERATLAAPPAGCAVHWFELTTADRNTLPPAATAALERWRADGVAAEGHAIVGPSFWRATEIESAPALIDQTCALASAWAPVAASAAMRPSVAPAGPIAATWSTATWAGSPLDETALSIESGGQTLVGVLARPGAASAASGGSRIGVVVVVGGPQYRAGSHRQFTLLARDLARQGWPVLRFDLRGMGDSDGEPIDFTQAGPDIAAAIDTLTSRVAGLDGVVLWGLCDGASAALMYLQQTGDTRVRGLGLANPWVRSAQGLARAHVKHYYLQRLRDRSFWLKLVKGGVGLGAVRGLAGSLRAMRGPVRRGAPTGELPFQERMLLGAERFAAPLWLALSGRDLTAQEFADHAARSERWQRVLAPPRCQRLDLPQADHTFSDIPEMERLHASLGTWLQQQWPAENTPLARAPGMERCLA